MDIWHLQGRVDLLGESFCCVCNQMRRRTIELPADCTTKSLYPTALCSAANIRGFQLEYAACIGDGSSIDLVIVHLAQWWFDAFALHISRGDASETGNGQARNTWAEHAFLGHTH